MLEIIVEDNGHGIRARDENHIFEPFYATRLQAGGSGLGLSVAHGIIESHGGKMWFEHASQEENPGTRFHVTLPLEPAPAELVSG